MFMLNWHGKLEHEGEDEHDAYVTGPSTIQKVVRSLQAIRKKGPIRNLHGAIYRLLKKLGFDIDDLQLGCGLDPRTEVPEELIWAKGAPADRPD